MQNIEFEDFFGDILNNSASDMLENILPDFSYSKQEINQLIKQGKLSKKWRIRKKQLKKKEMKGNSLIPLFAIGVGISLIRRHFKKKYLFL